MSPFALGYETDVRKWTIKEALDRGTLVFECRSCRHLAIIEAAMLLAKFREGQSVKLAADRARCRRCGCRRVEALVRLKFGRGDLAWWPLPPRLGR